MVKTLTTFEKEMGFKGMSAVDLNRAQNTAFKLDDQIDSVIPFVDRANIFSGKAASFTNRNCKTIR